jgi:hypothetical protein
VYQASSVLLVVVARRAMETLSIRATTKAAVLIEIIEAVEISEETTRTDSTTRSIEIETDHLQTRERKAKAAIRTLARCPRRQ